MTTKRTATNLTSMQDVLMTQDLLVVIFQQCGYDSLQLVNLARRMDKDETHWDPMMNKSQYWSPKGARETGKEYESLLLYVADSETDDAQEDSVNMATTARRVCKVWLAAARSLLNNVEWLTEAGHFAGDAFKIQQLPVSCVLWNGYRLDSEARTSNFIDGTKPELCNAQNPAPPIENIGTLKYLLLDRCLVRSRPLR